MHRAGRRRRSAGPSRCGRSARAVPGPIGASATVRWRRRCPVAGSTRVGSGRRLRDVPARGSADVHRVGAVVDERHDGQDRGDAEQHGDRDREVRDDRLAAFLERGAHRPQHDQAVGEGADDEAHDPLVERIAEQGVHHPWRVLARGQLDDEQRHRERDAGEGDRRPGDGAQQRAGAVDGRGQTERELDSPVVEPHCRPPTRRGRARRRPAATATERRTSWPRARSRESSHGVARAPLRRGPGGDPAARAPRPAARRCPVPRRPEPGLDAFTGRVRCREPRREIRAVRRRRPTGSPWRGW